ncbi:hypothetical protein JOQ06_007812, partial [Pogonophryne albipinna]
MLSLLPVFEKEARKGERGGITETDLFLNTAERGTAPPLTGDQARGKLNWKSTPPLPVFKLVSAADQILTILALIRSGGRYPLLFRRHIRVAFLFLRTGGL